MSRHSDELDAHSGARGPAGTHCLLITRMEPVKNHLYLPQFRLGFGLWAGHATGARDATAARQ